MLELNKLYNLDCLPAMVEFPDKFFDLALVDPDYGIGNTWNKSRKDRFFKMRDCTYKNNEIPSRKYFEELFRVSENQIIFGGNYFTEFLRPTNSWIIWDKERDAGKTYMSEVELAWTSFKKVMRIVHIQWDGAKKGKETGIKKIHPFQKPIKLYKWILARYAKPSMKIIDTHVGSGSSIISFLDFGCDWIGFEIDEYFYKGVTKRIENHKLQLRIK